MRRNSFMFVAIISLMSPVLASPAYATIRTLTGTITVLGVSSTTGNIPGTVDIVMDQPLAATGCPGGTRGFEFDSGSVTDAQTRTNMLSTLLGAKLAGVTINILYDDGSAHCSTNGFAVPYGINF
jgi:hypothetical protein